jgi:tight adherence protein B
LNDCLLNDYRQIHLTGKQFVLTVLKGLIFSAGAAFLFYRSFFGLALAVIFVPLFLKRKTVQEQKKRKERLQRQFISGMQSASGALVAGYSMERALKSAGEDMDRLYGKDADFSIELTQMNQKISMNMPVEQVLYEFAQRSGCEDICNFAEIFQYAKRSGGNISEIIRNTVSLMQEKADIMAEISNAVAAKQAEQKLMNILLPGILLFITLGSPEYVSSLYHTPVGILVMSVCLVGYLFAIYWSERLLDISV